MDPHHAVAQFMSVTGASDAEARFHLEASGWNVDVAVTQYLDGGGPSMPQQGGHPQDIDALEEYVRAPDRAKQQRLLEPHMQQSPQQTASVPEAFADFRVGGRTDDDFDDDDQGLGDDDDDAAAQGRGGGATKKTNAISHEEQGDTKKRGLVGLAKLFAAPTKLIFRGDFQAARKAGKDDRKWLLVVLVDESSFANAEMNRDVWADETVAAVVESQFVLWMRPHVDREAVVYADRYDRDRTTPPKTTVGPLAALHKVHPTHPHIAVVDPRTGRRLWFKEGKLGADAVVEFLTDVADRHSMEDVPRKPDEALLNMPPGPPPAGPPVFSPHQPQTTTTTIAPPLPPTALDQQQDARNEPLPPWDAYAAPEEAPLGVLVQFRLLKDGKPLAVKRAFAPTALVGSLFKFVQIESDAGARPFELRYGFPPAQLWPQADISLADARLHGESIQMKFL
eukprot:CAMPEP_0118906340 /NCGR_PEP_ID=MMETSP1166-20130328/10074_1 /TAXON_ID=1104430 /ORGANISM="Chrysoreinhardia sp, Strain CCMP3193" /LENGTH=450 /DNA_ID=CAMNT_0006845645 /DNA_START=43 /DNA_END=1395 /DNA_ORIENTATION=+